MANAVVHGIVTQFIIIFWGLSFLMTSFFTLMNLDCLHAERRQRCFMQKSFLLDGLFRIFAFSSFLSPRPARKPSESLTVRHCSWRQRAGIGQAKSSTNLREIYSA